MKAYDTKTFTKVEKHIRTMTDAYLELGVCVIEDSWHKAYSANEGSRPEALAMYRKEYLALTSDTFVRAYLRAVAKELKRPFVVAHVYSTRVNLVIPRKKYTEPLFASFMLAPQYTSKWPKATETPVMVRGKPSNVEVIFNGNDGRKLFGAFIERCRTDEEYKKALRITS